MENKKIKIPMYFSSLEIENIKCFSGKQTISFTDNKGTISPWTLILGDNGVGKTTLLKCLAWMIPVEQTEDESVSMEQTSEKIKIKPFMDGFESESEYEQLIRVGENITSKVSATFTNGLVLGSIPTSDKSVSHAISIKTKKGKLDEIDLEYGFLEEFNAPNLFAYSASRHMAFKNFEKSELKDHTSNLFSDSGDLYDAEQLLTILDNAAIRQNGQGKAAELLKKVKQILADLLPDIQNPESIIINSPLKDDGSTNDILVEVQTHDGKVPLFNLSLGYQTMLAWTVDLALRMLWSNPDSETPLKEPAVVIVDEIDLHLHPKWQRTIREHLTHHFPNAQFICTAHSPFMAQASENENLAVITRINGEVHIKDEPLIVEGWRIGQVVTSDLFGISSERSPEIEHKINERRALIDKVNLSEEEAEKLKNLDIELSMLPVIENPDDQKLLEKIKQAAELLKNKGKL